MIHHEFEYTLLLFLPINHHNISYGVHQPFLLMYLERGQFLFASPNDSFPMCLWCSALVIREGASLPLLCTPCSGDMRCCLTPS